MRGCRGGGVGGGGGAGGGGGGGGSGGGGGGGGGGPPLTRRGSRVRDLQRMFDLDRGSGMLAKEKTEKLLVCKLQVCKAES